MGGVLMKVQLLSFMSVILLPVLSACSSSEDRDRKAFIEKCMYPNKAIKTAVYTEKSCTCYYDTIRKAYGKPFFNKPITTEAEQKRMNYARGYTLGACGGLK